MSFESPIEQKFFDAVTPFLRPEIPLTSQVEVQTKRGMRRLDFLLSDGKTNVVIECDGAAFHNFDSDLTRDVALFGVGAHAIFHFSGSFIHNEWRYLSPIIAYFLPEFFTQSPDLHAQCPLPTDGAYVRLAPTFPGLREELAGRVVDAWSLGILSTCHNLAQSPFDVPLSRALREYREKMKHADGAKT